MFALRYTKKFQNIWVADDFAWVEHLTLLRSIGFLFHRSFVAACEKAFIMKRVDLALKLSHTPILGGTFAYVVSERIVVLHFEQGAVVCPCQFVTQ